MTFRRKKCRNVRKGTDNSSDSLQPRLTRPSLFPGGKEMNRKTGWEKHRVGPGCGALAVVASVSHTVSLSVSLFQWEIFCRGSNTEFFKGKDTTIPVWRDWSRGGVLSPVSDLWVERIQTRWGFNSAMWEKAFSPCNLQTRRSVQDIFFYYFHSLLNMCFVYGQHFFHGKVEFDRERGEWRGRETQRKIRMQITQQTGASILGFFMFKIEFYFLHLKISLWPFVFQHFVFLQAICISATSRIPRHIGQSESWRLSGPGPWR